MGGQTHQSPPSGDTVLTTALPRRASPRLELPPSLRSHLRDHRLLLDEGDRRAIDDEASRLQSPRDLPPDRTPWPEFRVRSITDWLPVIEAGLQADGHPDALPLATAITAVLRGLLDDLNTTADHERTTNGLRAIAKLLTPPSR